MFLLVLMAQGERYSNVVTLVLFSSPGLAERLQAEVGELMPANSHVQVSISLPVVPDCVFVCLMLVCIKVSLALWFVRLLAFLLLAHFVCWSVCVFKFACLFVVLVVVNSLCGLL